MTMVYPSDTSRCALCDRRVRSTKHVCLYVVGARAAIGQRAVMNHRAFLACMAQPGGK